MSTAGDDPQYSWLYGDQVPDAPTWVRKPVWDFRVEWFNLKTFVIHHYGREWCGDVEGQNTYREYDVTGDPEGTEFTDAAVIDDLLERWRNHEWRKTLTGYEHDRWDVENGPDTEAVLWDLCRRGIIPAGRYLVTQWW